MPKHVSIQGNMTLGPCCPTTSKVMILPKHKQKVNLNKTKLALQPMGAYPTAHTHSGHLCPVSITILFTTHPCFEISLCFSFYNCVLALTAQLLWLLSSIFKVLCTKTAQLLSRSKTMQLVSNVSDPFRCFNPVPGRLRSHFPLSLMTTTHCSQAVCYHWGRWTALF